MCSSCDSLDFFLVFEKLLIHRITIEENPFWTISAENSVTSAYTVFPSLPGTAATEVDLYFASSLTEDKP